MKRLTYSGTREALCNTTISEVCARLSNYEDTGLSPEEVKLLKDEKETKVKFLREVYLNNPEIENEEESGISLSLYECLSCHWRFIGDCERFGYGGFDEQGTQTPDYCPMCGAKITDCVE